MSPRVQIVFSFLGRLFCHRAQPSNGIIPTRIEVKEFESDDVKTDEDKNEQETKQRGVNDDLTKDEFSCACWKDAARVLDKTFFVVYLSSVFIMSVVLIYLVQVQENPTKRCS